MRRTTTTTAAAFVGLALIAASCGGSDESSSGSSDGSAPAGSDGASGCAAGETDGPLAMFNWTDYIDIAQLDAFASEFGVSYTYDSFDSNEVMQPIIANGNSGYDLIVPSDYMVGIMIDGGFLKPLDKAALPNLSNLSPDFTDPSYDPGQKYSVPYQWGYTGLSVDTEVLGEDFPRSWSLVFGDEGAEYSGQITLLNDPREALGAALKYLGYSLNTTDQGQLDEATQLIESTRSRLLRFDTDTADELLANGETAIAQTFSGGAYVSFLEADDPDRYEFFVPEEGGTRWIDNMAIPFDAPHPCTALTFMNWLLEPEQGALLTEYNYYDTPNAAARPLLDEELLAFIDKPDLIAGDPSKVEEIVDTGDFEINYSDAFTAAKG